MISMSFETDFEEACRLKFKARHAMSEEMDPNVLWFVADDQALQSAVCLPSGEFTSVWKQMIGAEKAEGSL